MDIAVIVGIVGCVSSVTFAYIGYRRGTEKECKDIGKTNGALMSDIGYIKSGIDDLKRKQELYEVRHYELADRVTKAEESLKSAWYEIKQMKGPPINMQKLMRSDGNE